jgi:hypothetical protein
MVDAEDREQLAFMLHHHAGTKLRGFNSTHNVVRLLGGRRLPKAP